MSICLTRFPIVFFDNPICNINRFVLQGRGQVVEVCLTLWIISGGVLQVTDEVLYTGLIEMQEMDELEEWGGWGSAYSPPGELTGPAYHNIK